MEWGGGRKEGVVCPLPEPAARRRMSEAGASLFGASKVPSGSLTTTSSPTESRSLKHVCTFCSILRG